MEIFYFGKPIDIQYKYRRPTVITRNHARKHMYSYYGIVVYNTVAMSILRD